MVSTFLEGLLGTSKSAQKNEVLFHCPFCHHHKQKLAVNVATGQWHCWVCNTRGRSLFSLLRRINAPRSAFRALAQALGSPLTFTGADDAAASALMLPIEYTPLWLPQRDYEYRNALAYLHSRNVTQADILRFQLGYCTAGPYAHRIIIPSYAEDRKLNFFACRSYYESSLSYLNPTASKNIVGFESLISWRFPIVICEGPMDAIAIRRNAIPLFGKTLPSALLEQIVLNDVRDIYLVLDSDALEQALRIADFLLKQDINVYVVHLKEKDPGALGYDKMADLLQGATERLTFGGLVKAKLALI